jgi:hypothetical protein
MRRLLYSASACVALMLLGVQAATANMCVVFGSGYQLTSDTVEWSMRAQAGQTCVRGLRGATVILRSVEVVAPPKSGEVALRGPGFTFTADKNASGEDTFSLKVSGTMNGLDGSSTIVVRVHYNAPK